MRYMSAVLFLVLALNVRAQSEQWTVRYNSPGNYYDEAHAIAVDKNCNVYVTGCSEQTEFNYDYVTVKYNNKGKEEWTAVYNGPSDDWDWAEAIAIDGSDNVYVTGWSTSSATSLDYVTVKYNKNGEGQWVARYNGPGDGNDQAHAITVDGSGNVYITGESQRIGTNDDYATIKYTSKGKEQWITRYNGPGDGVDEAYTLVIDGFGNVYVTGSSWGSGTRQDYATIKYNKKGKEQWLARYDGPDMSLDEALALVIDDSGNVYVTGRSEGRGTYRDYATIKYNSEGAEQWLVRYNGLSNGTDEAHAIAIDNSGNVYVTGASEDSASDYDYVTIKYNNDGEEQWIRRYNGSGNGKDEAQAIALDEPGNIYVTGWSMGSTTSLDYVTIKYNSDGEELWIARYDGPGNGEDQAYGITIDGSGNVYITGGSQGSDTGYDYATIKYRGK